MAKAMTEAFVRQPLRGVAELIAVDIPSEPGIYAWYRDGTLFYVGESRRGLRSRLWGNHLGGNARSSTLRNKVAKSFGFPAIGPRKYGPEAEQAISSKLRECGLRFLAVPIEAIAEAQSDLISKLDPPMNDHPGEVPRWRMVEVREILEVESAPSTEPTQETGRKMAPASLANSQRVTLPDIRAGRIRFPRPAKRYFPKERSVVRFALRGVQLEAPYDPRTGPDRERSAVLLVGKPNLEGLVRPHEVLSVSLAGGIVQLD
jgi:GIY-YIG catalytic domain